MTRNTIKNTCWGREHTVGAPSVCAALCTWKHRFLALLSSETAISSGSSRRGKHQQFVEFHVGTEEALICSSYIHVLLWSFCLLQSGIPVLTIYSSAILWGKLQGKKDPDPSCSCHESRAVCSGVLLLCWCNFPFLEFTVETGFMCFFHYVKK